MIFCVGGNLDNADIKIRDFALQINGNRFRYFAD